MTVFRMGKDGRLDDESFDALIEGLQKMKRRSLREEHRAMSPELREAIRQGLVPDPYSSTKKKEKR